MILKLQSGLYWLYVWRHNHAINERAINRREINDYYGTIASMMKYGNFIEVYNNIYHTCQLLILVNDNHLVPNYMYKLSLNKSSFTLWFVEYEFYKYDIITYSMKIK